MLRDFKLLCFIGIPAVVAAALGVSCDGTPDGKKKIENQSADLASLGLLQHCGTVLSVGDVTEAGDHKTITLIAQAAICGQIPGDEEQWKALGLTVHTSSVRVKRAAAGDDGYAGAVSGLEVRDGKVMASDGAENVVLGEVLGDLEPDAAVKLADGVSVVMTVDGAPYAPDGLEKKEGSEQDVVFTVP